MNDVMAARIRERSVQSPLDNAVMNATADQAVDTLDVAAMIGDPDNTILREFYIALNRVTQLVSQTEVVQGKTIEGLAIEEAAKALNSARRMFSLGLATNRVEYLLLATVSLNFMQLSIDDNLDFSQVTGSDREHIAATLERLIQRGHINVSFGRHPAYSDTKFYSDYLEAYRKKDVQKVFEFIDAVDRGGGFMRSVILRAVTKLLLAIDRKRLCESLEHAQDFLMFFVCTGELSTEDALLVAESLVPGDSLQIITLMRRILPRDSKPLLLSLQQPGVLRLLRELYRLERNLTSLLLQKFSYSHVFWNGFGQFLASNTEYLEDFLGAVDFDLYGTFKVEGFRVTFPRFHGHPIMRPWCNSGGGT